MKVIHQAKVVWPKSKPKTTYRKTGRFAAGDIAKAAKRVESEVSSFTKDGHNWRTKKLTISAYQDRFNSDGRFTAGYTNTNDPRVVVSFDLDRVQYVIPCDAFTQAEQNLCAIAETIKGLRANERYGVLTIKQMMEGIAELPQISSATRPIWFDVLNVDRMCSLAEAETAYKSLVKSRHPDVGGTDQEWYDLQEAIATTRQVCK